MHRLSEALCEMYCGYIERSVREFRPDGFWTSDDLGHQKQLFARPESGMCIAAGDRIVGGNT